MITNPINLQVKYSSPFFIDLNITNFNSNDYPEVTQATYEIDTNSSFTSAGTYSISSTGLINGSSPTWDGTTHSSKDRVIASGWNDIIYRILSNTDSAKVNNEVPYNSRQVSSFYARVKLTDQDGDSDWSNTVVINGQTRPTTPSLEARTGSPTRVTVATTNIFPGEALTSVIFRTRKKINDSDTITNYNDYLDQIIIDNGPAIASFRVIDKQEKITDGTGSLINQAVTYFVWCRKYSLTDFDPQSGEELGWYSDWSSIENPVALIESLDYQIRSLPPTAISANSLNTTLFAKDLDISSSGLNSIKTVGLNRGEVKLSVEGLEYKDSMGNLLTKLPTDPNGKATFTGAVVSNEFISTSAQFSGTTTVLNDSTFEVFSVDELPAPKTAPLLSAEYAGGQFLEAYP